MTDTAEAPPARSGRRRWLWRTVVAALAALGVLPAAGWVALLLEDSGTPSSAARSSGHDAEWLGHAWVDGRRTQSDVDSLAGMLRDTGIRDLFVHSGPFRDDGTLDPGLRPRARHATLSLSASLLAPLPGVATAAAILPGRLAVWSPGYLRRLAGAVDQVAVMAYDTWLPDASSYAGYVRRLTTLALHAVPDGVALFIGVPAYHDDNLRHHREAETVPAAVRGVRLALGDHPQRPDLGIALYVDFAATAADWMSYRADWR